VKDGRRVVFVNPDDIARLGFADGQMVNIVSEWKDDPTGVVERRAESFRIVSYPTAHGCVATYFPEANPLVPLDSKADISGTPTSKSVIVRLEAAI
jgi:anaerobic selenocysteine-containing dehydrogenase